MKKIIPICSALIVLALLGCKKDVKKVEPSPVTKIAFGSCSSEENPLPIFNNIVNHQPDLFVFLGDNIYGDTKDMDVLKLKYQKLGSKESFKNLKANVPIIATWDDHDYGWNDIGKNYPFKKESKEIFLDFFEEPSTSERRQREGIYNSYMYDYNGKKLQIILLDGRSFRDDLNRTKGDFVKGSRYGFYEQAYYPHTSNSNTLLGEKQWSWLEDELKRPADVRIIGSGIQFGVEWNGWEAWANFPHEQKRLMNLIKETKANGVIFISGDVHYSEISKIETDFYPIYDFTSSGLSSTWYYAAPNKNRIEGPIMENHFGLITIDWEPSIKIKMETWDIDDNQRLEYTIDASKLSFKD